MPWLQLTIRTTRSDSASVEEALLELGAASVTLEDAEDQPILEPALGETPLWDNLNAKALFDASCDTGVLSSQLQNRLNAALQLRWEQLEDKDWSQEWKKYFQPIPCGKRLWICPSWQQPPQPDAVNLILDPGLAFGTGSHPTTHLCLRWLDSLNLQGKTVIDYGCGSGILGIAALLLGAESVIAVDNDPQALIATKDNAKLNNIPAAKIITCLPEQMPADSTADIVVANILAGPLVELAPVLIPATKDGGLLCLSGLLSSQVEAVSAPYSVDFIFEPSVLQEDWAQLAARKQNSRTQR